jgi:hypothetical protein
MARPGLEFERRIALATRASVLESIEDAVRSAMLEVPNNQFATKKTSASKLSRRPVAVLKRCNAPIAASTLKVPLQAQAKSRPDFIGTDEQVTLSPVEPRARPLQWFDRPERVTFNPMINRKPQVKTDRYGYEPGIGKSWHAG